MSDPGPWRERVAFAADVPLDEGVALFEQVKESVVWVKVGLSLFVEHGPRAVERFLARGARIFLDLKLHDIPNTVDLAAERAGALRVSLLTVHAAGGAAMIEAAVQGARRGAARAGHPAPRVLAVTVLTSFDESALETIGVAGGITRQVERLADVAARAGADGLVCSVREAAALRRIHPSLLLCTPGIRPTGSEVGDQARAETPAEAIRAGSDLLVVGRPLSQARDPRLVAAQLVQEMESSGAPR